MKRSAARQILLYSLPLSIFTLYLLKIVGFVSICSGTFNIILDCISQNYLLVFFIITLIWTILIFFFFNWLVKKQEGNDKGTITIIKESFKK